MLGPTGIGALYGKKSLLEKIEPFNFGGDMISEVTFNDSKWAELPMKFEAGTPNISGAIGFGEAIKYLSRIGLENISRWEKELLKHSIEQLRNSWIDTYTPGPEKSAGILSFNMKKVHSHDAASLLDDEGICIRGGHHCAMPLLNKLGIPGTTRASFYLYNTYEDIELLADALNKINRLFS